MLIITLRLLNAEMCCILALSVLLVVTHPQELNESRYGKKKAHQHDNTQFACYFHELFS